jgi:hypothetical protein
LEKEPFSLVRSLAEALDVSPATALSRLHNFVQFAGNEKLSSLLNRTPVDKRPTAGDGRKMR